MLIPNPIQFRKWTKKKDYINVQRHIEDPYYRYKMPIMRIKVEGRGKMIKTVILNLEEVAVALERPSDYILKFFGFEFGAPVTADSKSNKFTVGGDHKQEEMFKALDVFVSKYLVCQGCTNPETNLEIRKGNIVLFCRACGFKTQVDYPHKLTDYIIKKHPTLDKAVKTQPRVTKSDDPVEVMQSFWQQKPNAEDILVKVKDIQIKQGWTSDQTLRAVFASLFDKHILTDFDTKIDIFQLFVSSQKSQETTLFCIEKLCTMEKSIIPLLPVILNRLHEKRVLKATEVKQWFKQPHPKIDKKFSQEIRDTVKDFVQNLPTEE